MLSYHHNRYKKLVYLFCFLFHQPLWAQEKIPYPPFTKQDTLRGSVGPGRILWDVLHYDLTVEPDLLQETIKGINHIRLMDSGMTLIQIDLQEPMLLDSVGDGASRFSFYREGNVYWVQINENKAALLTTPKERTITAWFHGKPKKALRAPWDNGWIWNKDSLQNPFVSVTAQGMGASMWYPCKDHQSDEPDLGAILRIRVPDSLQAVGNGKLIAIEKLNNGSTLYSWEVKNPINNYTIIPTIAKFVHFSEIYAGKNGPLSLDYWVLAYHLEKAKKQFTDVPRMLQAFEYWFGPYPFYEDGYKLVESPHLGMEHQSATAYGNEYMKGYLGSDLSGTGWGLLWDFIIIHESGHEWFGNSITSKDIADMWVHESFTNYSETLFTDYHYGKKAGNEYAIGIRKNISNDRNIIGYYGVNKSGSIDMYYKGGNMLHSIRQVINNDKKFRKILHGLGKTFYHRTVTGKEIEGYIIKEAGIDFSTVFDQYLRTTNIPELQYKISDNRMQYRYTEVVPGFHLPLKIKFSDQQKETWIYPTENWQTLVLNKKKRKNFKGLLVNKNFYIYTKAIP